MYNLSEDTFELKYKDIDSIGAANDSNYRRGNELFLTSRLRPELFGQHVVLVLIGDLHHY